jgi:U3 small nucleolar RNA-associated protein 22
MTLSFLILYSVNAAPVSFPAYKPSVELDFPSRNQFIHYFIPKLLAKGLKTRTKLIHARSLEQLSSWSISFEPNSLDKPGYFPPLLIGFVLDIEQALKIVEQGPPPAEDGTDSKEVTEFRRLWGMKADLRRFKDGTLAQSVVWETDGTLDDRSLITAKMAAYLVSRHVGVESKHLTVWGGQFLPFLRELNGYTADRARVGTFQNAMDAFNAFVRDIKGLSGELPLSVTAVNPVHSGLRSSSVFVPQPHPTGDAAVIAAARVANRGPILRDVMDVLLEFESSSRWPEDFEALQQMKLAFFIKIAEGLAVAVPGTVSVVSKPSKEDPIFSGHLDVTPPSGYTFRVRIKAGREVPLIQQKLLNPSIDGKTRGVLEDIQAKALKLYQYLPYHSSRMQNLCLRHSFLPSTIRLLKRFVSAHLLLGRRHIPEEAIELIAAHLYVNPAPYASPPSSAWSGFVRGLELLGSWDWSKDIMVVEFEKHEVPAETRAEILKRFTARRSTEMTIEKKQEKHMESMCIATKEDLNGQWWTSKGPNVMVLQRLKALAGVALRLLRNHTNAGADKEIVVRL